jgi:CDGSH-type Zn-finger protein
VEGRVDSPIVADEQRVVVKNNGPYLVEGGVRLLRTEILQTEHGEPYDWAEGPDFITDGSYELCRCGGSERKPFCDGVCERNGFDGTEKADRGPIAARREPWEGETVVLYDDRSLCTHAGFCTNLKTTVWALAEESGDEESYTQFVSMMHQCPSGRLSFAPKDDPERLDEPAFDPPSIGVEPNASYWLRGGIPVMSEDGSPYEVRNRQTLCRCGFAHNKPFCDGSHAYKKFRDDAMPPAG